MKYIQTTNSYTRRGKSAGIRRARARRGSSPFPGGIAFWRVLGRLSLVVCGVTLSLNIGMGFYKGYLESEYEKLSAYQAELVDKRVSLNIEKVGLRSKDAIKDAAGKNLSLFTPGNNQHFRYDHNLGRFREVSKAQNVASL